MNSGFQKFIFVAVLAAVLSLFGAPMVLSAEGNYFPYPTPPDTMQNLYDRTDYIVTHFWDRCDMKKAFSSRPRMSEALKDYLELMPYASRRTAHRSVATLLKSLEKQPDDLMFMTQEAEKYLYSDSCLYFSEELVLPFMRAAASTKKGNKETRARYDRLSQILVRSMIGAPTPYIDFTDRDGNHLNLTEVSDSASLTLVVIDTPDCLDCRIARTRLNADINVTALVNNGVLKIIDITPSEAGEEWKTAAASYPSKWIIGATPEIENFIDVRGNPYYILIDKQGMIRLKTPHIQEILSLIGL